MEILSDILRTMRVRGSLFFCDLRQAPWRHEFADTSATSFHVVRRGECWVTRDEHTDYLGPGDMVLIEAGKDHVLSSDPPGLRTRNPGAETMLLCGYWEFHQEAALPLSELIPQYCILRAAEIHKNPWLSNVVDQLSAEYLSQRPGAELVIDKLTEIVIVELIRISFGRSEESRLIRALGDRHVTAALEQLHRSPGDPWTIDKLARHVGLSRAALARRFRELVGQPVFGYLTRIRIQRARELLQDSTMPIWEVANNVGYESDISFARAFRKLEGQTPTQFRKSSP
jgi:AraC-like DNA-binding protein